MGKERMGRGGREEGRRGRRTRKSRVLVAGSGLRECPEERMLAVRALPGSVSAEQKGGREPADQEPSAREGWGKREEERTELTIVLCSTRLAHG